MLPVRKSPSLLCCPRISHLLWPGLRQSTHRGHMCPICHWCNCHLIRYVRILISIQSIWILCLRRRRDPLGNLLLISPILSPESPLSCASPDVHSRPDEASASVDSGRESPATAMSITDHTRELQLMTPPLIPLPAMINVQIDPDLLLQLTQVYREWLPQLPPSPQPIGSRFCPGRDL